MAQEIPFSQWQPLRVDEIKQLFTKAPFAWGLAGGYAIEQFLGKSIREHGDIDIVVFRDNQIQVQRWLSDWQLYAADPPGTLRPWITDEYLHFGIHDIWCHQTNAHSWQLQIMLAEVEDGEWFSRRNPLIRGQRDDLFANYKDTPCVQVEVQLLFKARGLRLKDDLDFQACLPLLSENAREWLSGQLSLSFPEGHKWLNSLI
jgi:aminoglycoside-2''-adenylyltransferase